MGKGGERSMKLIIVSTTQGRAAGASGGGRGCRAYQVSSPRLFSRSVALLICVYTSSVIPSSLKRAGGSPAANPALCSLYESLAVARERVPRV